MRLRTKPETPAPARGAGFVSAGMDGPLPGLPPIPVVDFLLRLILGVTVALLQAAFELILLAVDDIEVVVGELAPLLLHLALDLLPVSFNAIPIHRFPPAVDEDQRAATIGVPKQRRC